MSALAGAGLVAPSLSRAPPWASICLVRNTELALPVHKLATGKEPSELTDQLSQALLSASHFWKVPNHF